MAESSKTIFSVILPMALILMNNWCHTVPLTWAGVFTYNSRRKY